MALIKEAAEKGKRIIVLCDDAYFGLFYEENIYPESLFAKLSNLHKNVLAIKVDGATKEEFAWGLRVGFITYGNKNLSSASAKVLEDKTSGSIRSNISNCSTLSQSLVLAALNEENHQKDKEEKFNLLKARYLEVKNVLNDKKYEKYFKALPFNSGYFMCIEVVKEISAEKVRQILLEKYDTGVIVSDQLIRIAFSAVAKKDIKQLFENIYSACEEIL